MTSTSFSFKGEAHSLIDVALGDDAVERCCDFGRCQVDVEGGDRRINRGDGRVERLRVQPRLVIALGRSKSLAGQIGLPLGGQPSELQLRFGPSAIGKKAVTASLKRRLVQDGDHLASLDCVALVNQNLGHQACPLERKPGEAGTKRARYHHGQLREALIKAAHQLIEEHGPEGFSLAEACRVAGVSTAAPYRHFADRGALVEAVASEGFGWLRERTQAARDVHPMGSIESIVAMGQAYVAFAADEPAIFKLMFGRHPDVQPEGEAHIAGGPCFQVLLDAVDAWIEQSGAKVDHRLDVALPLWTIFHGTAYLLIDHDFDAVAPGTDVERLIEWSAVAFLRRLAE